MPAFINTFFERRVEQLFDLAELVEEIFSSAGLEYRIAGGLAVYLYVEEAEPDAGRLTKDVDITVRREDLQKIAKAAEASVRRGIHLVFAGERVRPEYAEPAPELGAHGRIKGLRLIPLAGLIHMKLTSFRANDEAHLKDHDDAGLITPVIECSLSPVLAERLARLRARA